MYWCRPTRYGKFKSDYSFLNLWAWFHIFGHLYISLLSYHKFKCLIPTHCAVSRYYLTIQYFTTFIMAVFQLHQKRLSLHTLLICCIRKKQGILFSLTKWLYSGIRCCSKSSNSWHYYKFPTTIFHSSRGTWT